VARPRELLALGSTLLLLGCGSAAHGTIPIVHTTTVATAESAINPTSETTGSPVAIYEQRCSTDQLALKWGGRVSEPTGQNTLSLTLTNISATGCYLLGYPKVALVDAKGQVLPFKYLDAGDQVVTSALPEHVALAPATIAYVTVNKYRCDLGDLMQATVVRLGLPGETPLLAIPITDNISMTYCGSGDPGSTVYVSPIEPSFLATV